MNIVFKLLVLGLLTASAQAETLFVTLEKDNALALVDPIEGKLIKTVEIGQRPRGIVISPDYKVLYIAVSDDNTVKRNWCVAFERRPRDICAQSQGRPPVCLQ
jgi:sugar lactone lactonase YvrE